MSCFKQIRQVNFLLRTNVFSFLGFRSLHHTPFLPPCTPPLSQASDGLQALIVTKVEGFSTGLGTFISNVADFIGQSGKTEKNVRTLKIIFASGEMSLNK